MKRKNIYMYYRCICINIANVFFFMYPSIDEERESARAEESVLVIASSYMYACVN
jgi:hypothetical protein